VVHTFFNLASVLLSRAFYHHQPEDIKSSVKYFRFIRINFHTIEAFDIPHGQLASRLVYVLARNVMLGSGDKIQDMEEIVALIPEVLEVLAFDISESMPDATEAIGVFADVLINTEMIHRKDTQQLAGRGIQLLREAARLKPNSDKVSYAFASCLAARFEMVHVIKDYEDAMTIANKIFATHTPGDSLTSTQRCGILLIHVLLVSRLNTYSRPEYLEDAIPRIRTLLCLPSLQDEDRPILAETLEDYSKRHSRYFGVTLNLGKTLPGPADNFGLIFLSIPTPRKWVLDRTSQMVHNLSSLREILTRIKNGELADTETAVSIELSRTLLPSQQSGHPLSFLHTFDFAYILLHAFENTKRLDYLNEAITVFRDLRMVSGPKAFHFQVGHELCQAVIQRHVLSKLPQDLEEGIQLYAELANDGSGEVFGRFKTSCFWAHIARVTSHPSTSTAYETALSLLQQSLVFSPTLKIQHLNLANIFRDSGAFPSEYASYQIERGQFKEAVEILERGRALLWSEMRGLRTSTDRLRAADTTLADKFVNINRRLELVTMFAQSETEEIGDTGTVIGRQDGTDSIGHLVTMQRSLVEVRETLISHIQSLPGFENFLKPPSFDVLHSAAAHGPVIIINQVQSLFPSHSCIIILLKDSPPSVISVPFNFHDRAIRLKNRFLLSRKESGLDSKDYDVTLASVLADLYKLVGQPVIERLGQLEVQEKSRVWWCPTNAFCSLPLHAMGPIQSGDGKKLYFSDMYITSYTPTLSALIESRKPKPFPETFDKPSLLLVAQPATLLGVWDEIKVVQTTQTPVTSLVSAMATRKTVVERLRNHQFAHFACHGLLETGKPFDASFELYEDKLTLLDIVRSQLPSAEFAFLSACHTAELTEDSIADEGLHLAAAIQFCGFRSVVGTMWAMADTDGADLSKHFYKSFFAEKAGQNGAPHYERSARALHIAVKKLRKKRGITLERWVNFVHYGA
jgi:CHAT domain-containing protein